MTAVLARRLVLTSCAFIIGVVITTIVLLPLGTGWFGFILRTAIGWPVWSQVMRVWEWSRVE